MENKLEVSFNSPQCGWMSIGFDDGTSEFHTTTANAPHAKALPEILRILTRLLGKDDFEQTLAWNRNPEEFDFFFAKKGEDVSLAIYQYPTEDRLEAEAEQVFTHAGKAREICQSFYETFAQLYEDRNTDEFEFNWRQPFPFEEFENFKSKLNATRI
jgi:hypothetical protein